MQDQTNLCAFEQLMTIFWRALLHAGLMVAACISVIPPTLAEPAQDLDSITAAAVSASEQRARQHGYNNVKTEVRPLDSRLRLPLCSETLSTISPHSSHVLGSVNIGVRCTGEKPWTIYVRANISALQSVPVLARPLPRNAIVSKDDLRLIDQPIRAAANGIIFDPKQIIGMELVRPLNAGSTIKVSQLRAPKVIIRGQQVTLVANFNGLDVRIQAKALRDAAAGERVMVSNLSSGKRVEGIAHRDGTVWVP